MQVANKKAVASDENTVSQSESVEEFDEDEDGNVNRDGNVNEAKSSILNQDSAEQETPKANPVAETPEVLRGCDETIVDSTSEPSTKQTEAKVKANPESTSKDRKNQEKSATSSDDSNRTDDTITSSTEESVVQSSSAGQSSSGKNKNKNRQRNKVRHQIDMDDTEEEAHPQKYSGWMPPENQTGDGVTALNSKYGY